MTKNRIIYTRADGGVSIVVPSPEFIARYESEPEALAAVKAGSVPVTISNPPPGIPDQLPRAEALRLGLAFVETPSEIVDEVSLPTNREFRDAWRKNANAVDVDMPAARSIHMRRIRTVRDSALLAADTEQARVTDIGTPSEIAALKVERQKLRDMPATVDLEAAATPEALSKIWPTGLARA